MATEPEHVVLETATKFANHKLSYQLFNFKQVISFNRLQADLHWNDVAGDTIFHVFNRFTKEVINSVVIFMFVT